MQSLPHPCTVTVPPLHNLCTGNVQLLCHCYAVTVQSLCRHYPVTIHSPCSHYTFTMQSLCSHHAVTIHSPCSHYAVAMAVATAVQPWRCHQYKVTLHRRCEMPFAATHRASPNTSMAHVPCVSVVPCTGYALRMSYVSVMSCACGPHVPCMLHTALTFTGSVGRSEAVHQRSSLE